MRSAILERRSFSENSIHLSSGQLSQDALLASVSHEAADPLSIVAMLGGSLAFKTSRLFLGRLASPLLSESSAVTRFFLQSGIRASSLVSEVVVFRGISSGPSKIFQSQEFARDFLGFGLLKSIGKFAQNQNPFMTHFLQSAGMVAGEHLAYHLDFSASPQGNLCEQFAHAEATNLKMGLGMSLAGFVAPSISRVERSLELENASAQIHEFYPNSLRKTHLPIMSTIEDFVGPRSEGLEGCFERFVSKYEEELLHLVTTDTPFRILALETLRNVDRANAILEGKSDINGVDRLMDDLKDYSRRRHEVSTTLIIENRKILPQFRDLLDSLSQADHENRIRSTQSDVKDERKIPLKLLDRRWRSMRPFSDLVRGKIIVRKPEHARWVLDKLHEVCGDDCRIREIYNSEGAPTGVPDIEPYERILDGYIRGHEKFELRRIKVVMEFRDSEGTFHPAELQIMTPFFDRWGEIQRRLVKDNKISQPVEWAMLNNYCNAIAQWLSAIERGESVGAPPHLSRSSLLFLAKELQDSVAAMEVFVEEVESQMEESNLF